MWSPEQYGRFADERSQPFFDLLARVDLQSPRAVADLGCGPGALTATLAARFSGAQIRGVDSSPEMLAIAAGHAIPGRLSFELADIATWSAPEPLDLLVANASLQWVPDHAGLLARLSAALAPGGVLAIQMPFNFDAPSHTLLREVCASPAWVERLAGALRVDAPVEPPAFYFERLLAAGLHADVWETTYYHVLQGDDPVLEWTLGTALRPIWARLDPAGQAEFRVAYGARLREAYPRRSFGTLFPFRRLFILARRAGDGG